VLRAFRLWASVCLLGAGLAHAEPVSRLLDISNAGANRVAQLKKSAGVDWWLELGEGLLVTGDRQVLDRLPEAVLSAWPELDPDSLVLEARGCGVDPRLHLPALADAGRFALLRLPPMLARYPGKRAGEWQPVVPNTSYASVWNNDPAKALTGAVADPLLQQVVDAVDPVRWQQQFTTLTTFDRNTFGPGRILARDWLVQQFQGIANISSVTTPSFTFNYASQQRSAENVLAIMPGTTTPDEWVIVGGHYDSRNTVNTSTVNTPGAEDNATGCAGVLEMARVLSQFAPQRSVLFMCYSGEEQGLFGSAAHAQSLLASGDATRVAFMLNMDMIGYSGDADLDVLIESTALGQPAFARFGALASIYAPSLRIVTSLSPCCSDHIPYLNVGIPAVLTIANDWNSYIYYHTANDVPANVTNSLAMGGNLLKMNAAFLAETARASGRSFANGFE